MDIYGSMRNWAKQQGIFGGGQSTPSSPGMDMANQLDGMGGAAKQAWSGAQPGQVQMGGQTIGIPRQPWGFGAMPEAVTESPPVQQALASDETSKEINWAALAQLFGQMRQGDQSPRGFAPMPIAGRGRQVDVNPNYAPAPLDPRLLVNGGRLAPRRA